MHDVLPEDVHAWQRLEAGVREVMEAYGYAEIRTPLLEHTALFVRSLGAATDVVEKEMYTFVDRDKRSLTLRPENTASCVRSGIQHGFVYQGPARLWYMGPMFRHERQQKGRYRQFSQFGVEAFGLPDPDIEAEIIALGQRLWKRLGIDRDVRLEINTLGTAAERAAYRARLVDYLQACEGDLDADSRRRLHANPLRVLDSKNPALQGLIEEAPRLWDDLGSDSRRHFEHLRALLDALDVDYRVVPRLVRGLDYYSHTVFEWVTERLGAQGAVCAGGRYDGLVEQLGGKPTPGVGFASGMERLLLLIAEVGKAVEPPAPHAYLVLLGERAGAAGLALAERLRDELPGLRLRTHCGGGSVKSQMRRADRSGAQVALILGEAELDGRQIQVKALRSDAGQRSVAFADLAAHLDDFVAAGAAD